MSIALVAKGDQFLVLQDGEVVAQAKDDRYRVGKTAFGALSSSQNLAVLHVDNLVVRTPEGDPLRDWISVYESAFDPAASSAWPQSNSSSRNTMFTTYCNGWPEFGWTDVFLDSFDLPADPEWPVGETDDSRSVYEDGRYVVQGTTAHLQTFHFLPGHGAFRDVAIEVDLDLVTESGSALVVFGYKDGSDYYVFQLSATSSYSLYRRTAGEWTSLSDWTSIEGVPLDSLANVRIEIVGQEMCVMLDGDELLRVADVGYEGGRIGIGVSTSDSPPCTVHYDRMWVSRPAEATSPAGDWSYGLHVRSPGVFAWSYVPGVSDLLDIAVESLAIVPDSYDPDGSFGFLFGYRDADNYCKFTVFNNGSYRLAAKADGEWHTIIPSSSHSALRSGGTNRIAFVVHRQWVSLFANGELLNSVLVPQLVPGRVALFVGTSDQRGSVVYFDDLVIRANVETLTEQAMADLSLGRERAEEGYVDEAEASFQSALAKLRLLGPPYLPVLAAAEREAGHQLLTHGYAVEALRYFQDAHKTVAPLPESTVQQDALARLISRAGWPESLAVLAEELFAAGCDHFEQSAHGEAIAYLDLALPYLSERPAKEQLTLCLVLLAVSHYVLGDADQAAHYAKQTLPHFAAGVDVDRLLEVSPLMLLADYYSNLWDYDQAIVFYRALLAVYQELQDRPGEAGTLQDLGRCYHAVGSYETAIDCLTASLPILRELDDGEAEVAALNVLGACYCSLNDYSAAIATYEEALGVSAGNDDYEGQARSMTNLGNVYGPVLGEYGKAIEYYEQALKIAREASDQSREARLLDDLGLLYVLLQDYDRAKDHYEQSLAVSQEAGDLAGEAVALKSLGLLHEILDDLEQAVLYREQSVLVARELGNPWREGESLISLGQCRHRLEDYFAAIKCYEEVVVVASTIPEMTTIAYELMGLSHRMLMNLDDAAQSWKRAIGMIEEMRARLEQVELKSSFMRGRFDVYEELVSTLLDTGDSAEAIFYAERAKARILVDMMETAMVTRSDILLPDVQTASHVLGELSGFRGATEEPALAAIMDSSETRSGLARAWQSAQAEYEAILEELEREHPELSGTLSVNPERLWEHFESAQGELGEGTVALEYFVTADETILWVISQDGIQTTSRIAVSREELVAKVRDFQERISSPPSSKEKAIALRAVQESGRDLYDLLIAPVEEYLEDSDHLVIVPSDILFYLPFGTLYDCPDCTGADLLRGQYLIEQVSVSYAPSLASLYWPLQHRGDGTYDSVLAVGADPDPARPLRYTADEALAVASSFPVADVVLNAQCTEAEIKSLLGQRMYDVVHLSTHGSFDPVVPLLSQVQLLPGDGEDGALYAGEILGLGFSGSLVVLSACQTALPAELTEETAGLVVGDEIQGLGQALFTAGASSAVLTLWSVDDRSTRYLMESLYTSLVQDGADKASALQEAQRLLIGDSLYQHPYYWAPFVLYGDWR